MGSLTFLLRVTGTPLVAFFFFFLYLGFQGKGHEMRNSEAVQKFLDCVS